MIKDAKRNLAKYEDKFEFIKMDGNIINFENETFDIIIANHMLYHVNDRRKLLKEIQRVLMDDGCFYAATNGDNHMKELKDLVKKYDLKIELESKRIKFNYSNLIDKNLFLKFDVNKITRVFINTTEWMMHQAKCPIG